MRSDSRLADDFLITPLNANSDSPLIVEPKPSQSKIEEARRLIEDELGVRGALIFRGFDISSAEALQGFAEITSSDRPDFREESSPRSQIKDAVHTSTDYPEDYPIQFHNEYSYANEWPMKLYFACIVPPLSRGETPIASTRSILRRLRPSTVEAFRNKGILYVRNFQPGFGVTWETAFQTSDKKAVEDYCSSQNLLCEWLGDDVLRTRKVQKAIIRHPKTGEEVWFNHGYFWNIRSLEPLEVRDYFLSLDPYSLNTNTFFGDGTVIEEEIIDEIKAAYEAEAVLFPWQKGDVLLIDNMLMSHGRSAFSGPRRIVVLMADGMKRKDLNV